MNAQELQSLGEPLLKNERDVFVNINVDEEPVRYDRAWLRRLPHRALQLIIQHITLASIIKSSKRFAYCFVPQIIRSRYWNDHAKKPKFFPTSYLNGLRGITAIKVFTFHYVMAFSRIAFQPWGMDDDHYHFLELPIIRYFYAGFTAHLFFGIAGYLTSLRLFQLLDKHNQASHSKVLLNVSGSLFRRAFRLYLPVFVITLITAHYIHFGFYEFNRQYIMDFNNYFPGTWNEIKPEMFSSWWTQMCYWAREMSDLTNIFELGSVYPYHDQHLWSILAELKGSIFLTMIVVGLAQCKRYIRLAGLLFMTFVFFWWNHWEVWVYILGAAVAQLDLILTEREEKKLALPQDRRMPPSPPHSPKPGQKPPPVWVEYLSRSRDWRWTALRATGIIAAFYLLSYPIDGPTLYAPGYMTLNQLIPKWMLRQDKFYPNLGTALLILLLARSNPETSRWRKILNSDQAQYLGKISFAMYLVHGPILHAFGYMIPHRIWWSLGVKGIDASNLVWLGAILVGWSLSLVVSLAAADVWTREVEGRCVTLVKKLEDICFVKQ
jgi:peptidoglycan/LPS O-acetylase OafA/YrhL